MVSCAISTCKNTVHNCKNDTEILFHRFPKDQILAQQWEAICKRGDKKINVSNARICSRHFCSEDYERVLRAELTRSTPRRILKPIAKPSQGLPLKEDIRPTKRKIRMQDREWKRFKTDYFGEKILIMTDCSCTTC